MKNYFLLFIVILILMVSTTEELKAQERPYKDLWRQVDSLSLGGYPQSALAVLQQIMVKAEADNNIEELIIAQIHELKFKNSFEEGAFEKLLTEMAAKNNSAPEPAKSVQASMLGEMYWWYYQNNYWKFASRTETINFDNNDMTTWTLEKLTDVAIKYFLQSLQSAELLKITPVDRYNTLIPKNTKPDNLRPTLYDFLANRAIDFFINNTVSLTRPADVFVLNNEMYFADAQTFANLQINSNDTLSLHFHAIRIFQELLKFRLNDVTQNSEAFIDVELRRLMFVHANSIHPKADSLYMAALKNLESKYPNSAMLSMVRYQIARQIHGLASKYNLSDSASFQYKYCKKEALQLYNAIIEMFPSSEAAELSKQQIVEIQTHNIEVTSEKVIAEKDNFPLHIAYRNINNVYVKVAKIEIEKLHELENKYYDQERYDQILKAATEVSKTSFQIPVDEDYNTHTLDFPLNGLELGTYVIFVSNNPDFTYVAGVATYTAIQVSNISYIQRRTNDNNHEFYVLDRRTGKPLQDVNVTLYSMSYRTFGNGYNRNTIQTLKTDSKGYFKTQNFDSYISVYADFKLGNDLYTANETFYLYHSEEESPVVQIVDHIFTDRAIYRPGQTIYFKGIRIQNSEDKVSILPEQKLSVTLYDVNYQKISEIEVKTNQYGSYNGTFQIPTGLLNGSFHISTDYGTKYIQVEEYKRPKFEVTITPLKQEVRLNDSVAITAKAIAFSGAKITDATVNYRVIRMPRWFGWWAYWGSFSETEIENGTLTTNEMGEFTVNFLAQPDLTLTPNENMAFNYKIIVDVTDINGETQSDTYSFTVGYKALVLGIDMPVNIDKQIYEKANISTQNLDGQAITATGELRIFSLKSPSEILQTRSWSTPEKFLLSPDEWKAKLPNLPYNNENEIQNFAVDKEIFKTTFNTAQSNTVLFNQMKTWETGAYLVELTATDKFGNKVVHKQYFTLFSSLEKKLPYPTTFVTQCLNLYAQPNDVAKILVGTSYENATLIYEIEQKGVILESRQIKLSNEQKVLEIPIKEQHRGNISVHLALVYDNVIYNQTHTIIVPFTNKELKLEFSSFRNKLLPGSDEEWRIKITGSKGEKVAAEMLATLYDASLDQFARNGWWLSIYNYNYPQFYWQTNCFSTTNSILYKLNLDIYYYPKILSYRNLSWFGFTYYPYFEYNRRRALSAGSVGATSEVYKKNGNEEVLLEEEEVSYFIEDDVSISNAPAVLAGEVAGQSVIPITRQEASPEEAPAENLDNIQARSNLNETAFFFPNLETDADGNVIVKFTIPEALTEWRMLGLAHTKNLEYGTIENSLVTQKDLMVMPNLPRFLREGDEMILQAKIANISENDLQGKARIEFFDALTMQPITNILKDNAEVRFEVKGGLNTVVSWKIKVPEGLKAVTCKIVAQAGDFSDGEENVLPVLTNRMLVTETLPLPIRGNETKSFTFQKLVNANQSSTLRHEKLTLEFTSNPAWYAVQALPYLMEYPYECAEQVFSRFYANTLASHIANSSPKIKAVFDAWRNTPQSEALLSNLEKNQELKSILLEETPWVLNSQDETQRKRNIALLFDLNKMSTELNSAIRKLKALQKSSGGFPWFEGMDESRYITQHIACGFGHLYHLGVISEDNYDVKNMIQKAVEYLDDQLEADYRWLKRNYSEEELKNNHLSRDAIQYLYMRSFFEFPMRDETKTAFDYYFAQAQKYWLTQSIYMQGMIALSLHRYQDTETAKKIVASIKEFSTSSEEMGMYWKTNIGGYYWYEAPIETQALLIEVFHEVTDDKQAVDDMRVWLLKQKQTQDWNTTKATVEAVYALLLEGSDWLDTDVNVQITVGNQLIDPAKLDGVAVEAGTGYFKTSWNGNEITPQMGNITVVKENDGVSWGAMYWQYFENLDKITAHETPLSLKKQLFVERITDRGEVMEPISENAVLQVGDKVVVRIELRVDRAMEFVHLKDMRAAAFEPVSTLSGYRYQDGLGYYQSTKDASTNFFIGYLPKGTYVFEYELRVSQSGEFSNGITTIQCLYAPEFASHSEGIRVKVKE